jgi:hypothetical protein
MSLELYDACVVFSNLMTKVILMRAALTYPFTSTAWTSLAPAAVVNTSREVHTGGCDPSLAYLTPEQAQAIHTFNTPHSLEHWPG